MTCPAMAYAIEAHGAQQYGDEPYRSHLFAVVQVLRDFFYYGDYERAGALHDVIEDTEKTRRDIAVAFGTNISEIVWACTGIGRTREIRNAVIYAKISIVKNAAPVKTADRIANVEAAKPGSLHARLYLSEAEAFHENVAQFVPRSMQGRLARAYKEAGG